LARLTKFGPLFLRKRISFGILEGSLDARAIAQALRTLESSALPIKGDVEALIPPALWGWEHRPMNGRFAIVYAFDDTFVFAITLRR